MDTNLEWTGNLEEAFEVKYNFLIDYFISSQFVLFIIFTDYLIQIKELLGEGSFGSVYRGVHKY